ncbi:hypothetical protein KC315_g4841 [Hortaea werneckii]|nr:hypothetical protein KC315_g4841 [Hortaea werneckii]
MVDSEDHTSVDIYGKNKQATLYDAVAGRVGYEGFLIEERPSKYRDTASTTHAAIPPEEVLFRRKNAPTRYEEDDVYSADRHLQAHQSLPDSDLLKAIHAYASDFYSTSWLSNSAKDFKSMDETALLAMGILLEEAAAAGLGKTGDLALVEADEDESTPGEHVYWYQGKWRRSVLEQQPTTGRGLKPGRERPQPRRTTRVALRPKTESEREAHMDQ